MKMLVLIATLASASLCLANDYYLNKNSTGTVSSVVYFPAATNTLRVISFDVTADNSTNDLSLAAGTSSSDVLKSALSTATNVVFAKNTLAANDVVLLQTAASVTAGTVYSNSVTTNQQITLQNRLGTNLVIGSVIRERLTNEYTVQTLAAADATTIYINATNGLVANDILELSVPGKALQTATITSASTVNGHRITLRTPVVHPVTIHDSLYERNITTNIIGSTASDGLSLMVAGTNGFADGRSVLIETVNGNMAVRVIDTGGTSTTNLTLTVAPGFAVASGDSVSLLTTQSYLALWPAAEGEMSVVLDTNTGLTTNDVLVAVPTGYAPWHAVIANTNLVTCGAVVVGAAFGIAAPAGSFIFEASQTAITTTFTATASDTSVIADVATSLTNGDRVVVFPSAGGVFENFVMATNNYALSTISFSAQLGLALSAGDTGWLLDAATRFPIGAATVRRDNAAALWTAAPNRPVRALLTGAAACKINNMTCAY